MIGTHQKLFSSAIPIACFRKCASSENEDYGINGDVCLILWFEFSKCDQLLSLNILIVIWVLKCKIRR